MSVDLKREPKHPFPTVTLAMWEESGVEEVLRILADYIVARKEQQNRNNEKRKFLFDALTQDGTAAQKRKAKSAIDEVLPVDLFVESDVYQFAYMRMTKKNWGDSRLAYSAAGLVEAMNLLEETKRCDQEAVDRLKRAHEVLAEEITAGRLLAAKALSLSDADAVQAATDVIIRRAIAEQSGPVDCPCDNCGEWFPDEKYCQCGNRRICWESGGDFLLGKGYVYPQAW
jgi:hypothetical protein